MINVFPDYYNSFKCINSKCRHNCCIGWDIYIDEETARTYRNTQGNFGKRLRENIDFNDEPCFILKEDKRCPFLNENNLCDIIIESGEENLCEICKKHPRFINELPGRTEFGLGLSCEEAARIIIGKKEPVKLVADGNMNSNDELILKREEIFKILQNRTINISQRFIELLKDSNAYIPEKEIEDWIDLFLPTEQLIPAWGTTLEFLKYNHKNADYNGFNTYMQDRAHEYEQLAVYLIYRYYANCYDLQDAAAVTVFAELCHQIIYSVGAAVWTKFGKFTFEDQVELIRTFSAEIEYSDTAMNRIWDELYRY